MNFKYKLVEGNDIVNYIIINEEGQQFITEDQFTFNGFCNNIHPYFNKQINFVKNVLESKNIFLNIITVPTVKDMYNDEENIYNGFFENEDIIVPNDLEKCQISDYDNHGYFLLRDKEMGRGYSVLFKVKNNDFTNTDNIEIIMQDHRDIVRQYLIEGDLIKSFNIDYNYEFDNDLYEY